MPKYFFTIVDGVYLPDAVGIDLNNDEMAKAAAQEMTQDLQVEQKLEKPLFIQITREDGSKVN